MQRFSRAIAFSACVGALLTAASSRPARAEADKKIVRTWKAKCSPCHGEDGKGATAQGAKMGVRDMTSAAFWKDATDAKMKDAITNGIKQTKDGKPQEMEPYKDKLKPEEIDGLVSYVKSFKK
jgi:mono/diheme cytochrome c family protein